jgi:hypothetical protein
MASKFKYRGEIVTGVFGIFGIILTWWLSKCPEIKSTDVTQTIKLDSSSNNFVQPISVKGDSNKVSIDQSNNKKEIAGDEVSGDKVDGNKTDNRTIGNVNRQGDTTIVNLNERPPRKLSTNDKNKLDSNIPANAKVVVFAEGSEEAVSYATEIIKYIANKTKDIKHNILAMEISDMTPKKADKFRLLLLEDGTYEITVFKDYTGKE